MSGVHKIYRKVTARGDYALGITLDKRFCQEQGIEAGDTIAMWRDPKDKKVLKIKVVPGFRVC